MDNENNVKQDNFTYEPVELTELFADKRPDVTFGDIIVTQAILCVAISIVFVLSNMLLPRVAQGMYTEFRLCMDGGGAAEAAYEAIAEFANSTPVTYD